MSSVPYFNARAWARAGLGQTEIDLIEFLWRRTGGSTGGSESFRILIEAVRQQLLGEISSLSARHGDDIAELDAAIAALHDRIDGLEQTTQPEATRRSVEIKKLRRRLEQLEAVSY